MEENSEEYLRNLQAKYKKGGYMDQALAAMEVKRMDYRELLKKYIEHVANNEGICFIDEHGYKDEELFTDEEWSELRLLRDEELNTPPGKSG